MFVKNLFRMGFILGFIFICLSFSFVCAIDIDENRTLVEEYETLNTEESYSFKIENVNLLGKTHSLNGGKFSDIQDAINNAKSGDTIRLSGKFTSEGKYIVLNKKLTITSSNGATLNGKSLSAIFRIDPTAKGSVIKNIVFTDGKSTNRGGAIYLNASSVVIDSCTFKNCDANSGGAIATSTKSAVNSCTIKNSIFTNNCAHDVGGAISYIAKNLDMYNCIFDSNRVSLYGNENGSGGVLQIGITENFNNCKIRNCNFTNNYVESNNKNAIFHGGVGCLRRDVTFTNCNFINNYAMEGGVLSFHDGGTVNNCYFFNNYATNYGGVIHSDETTQPLVITNSIFDTNWASNAGALALIKNPKVMISNSIFINNHVPSNGGAIYSINTNLNCYNSSFIFNTASNGGAIYGNNNINIIDSQFIKNGASCGGTIFSNCKELKLTNSLFENSTALYGGALFINKASDVIVRNSEFINNTALNGSAIYNDGTLNILNSPFNDNKATSYSINSSNNAPVKKGEDLIIQVKLLVGDNVIDAIYNNQGNILIDNNKPNESNLAINQEIVLILDNYTYIETTNDEGIAEFIIDTSELEEGNYTYFFIYIDSKLYAGIDDNATVEILKNNNTNSKKKDDEKLSSTEDDKKSKSKKTKSKKQSTEDYLKRKGYSNLRDLIINNSQKYPYTIDENRFKINEKYRNDKGIDDYLYNMWKINWPHTYNFEQFSKDSYYMNFLFLLSGHMGLFETIMSYYLNGKLYESNANGDLWALFNSEFIHFYGYNSHLADEKGAKVLLSFLLGIDENGNMSIGNALINLLSLLGSLGIKGSGILSKLTENRIFRILQNNKIYFELSRYGGIVKDAFFDVFNIISKSVNVVSTIIGRIGKKFVDETHVLYNALYSFYYNDVRNVVNFLNPENQQNIKNNLNNLANGVINKLSNSIKNIKNTVTKVVSNFNKNVNKTINKVTNVVKKVQNKINKVVKNVKSSVKQVTNKVGKLVNQVKTKIKQVTNKVQKTVKNIKSTVKAIKNKTEQIVKNEVNKVVSKVKPAIKTVKNTVKKVQTKVSNVVKTVKNTVNQVKTKGANLFKVAKSSVQKFKTQAINTCTVIKNNAHGVYNAGVNTIKKGVNWGVNKGKQLYNWGVNTAKQAYNWGVNKTKQGISWLRNTIHI